MAVLHVTKRYKIVVYKMPLLLEWGEGIHICCVCLVETVLLLNSQNSKNSQRA